jgi:hypothetical protein
MNGKCPSRAAQCLGRRTAPRYAVEGEGEVSEGEVGEVGQGEVGERRAALI